MSRRYSIKKIDMDILRILQKNSKLSLDGLAEELQIPTSTIHYRIKQMEKRGIIEGHYTKLDPVKLGKDFQAIIPVRAKYGRGYIQRVGKKIASIKGVYAVYFVLGEIDFIVMVRARDREEFQSILEQLTAIEEIERTCTNVVTMVIKEDYALDI